MRKPKIIFIGDYSQKDVRDLLDKVVLKYSGNYDISATGYNTSYIQRKEAHALYTVCGMSSPMHFYDKNIAEYVVITTQAARFVRERSNQKIIYVLSDFDRKIFAGVIGDIGQFITDKEDVYSEIASTFSTINACLLEDNTKDRADCIVQALDIENEDVREVEDYLLVSSAEKYETLRDQYGVGRYLRGRVAESEGTVIGLTEKVGIEGVSSNILFDESIRTSSVIEGFSGTILFDSDVSKTYFEEYVRIHSLSLNTDKLMMLGDYQLAPLEAYVQSSIDAQLEDTRSKYTKYRNLIECIYCLKGCEQVKVSVIICRYNTPLDLMDRAVESALKSGHENVEVIIVDDGSQDNIDKHIKDKFNNNLRVQYIYKDNEGLGLSRNFGVKHATGKYVFYLDSDDTIHDGGLRCLVAHAEFFDLEMVIGKRILCDENGLPRSESLRYLAGDCFNVFYRNHKNQEIYDDVMVNNLLIRRESLLERDIWFTKGLYEDVEYSAKLYSNLPEYHYINVGIHDWYQYGSNTTISSSVSLKNLQGRIEKEESAWEYLPENIKESRLASIMLLDFNMYLQSFYLFSEDERLPAWELIRDFVADRKKYIRITKYPEKIKELSRAILENSYDYFRYVIDRYYMPEDGGEAYDDYIAFTHYHLYVACLYAIKSKRKSRLFISQSYIAFDTNLICRIRETGIFESVTSFIYGNTVGNLFKELELRPDEADLIIPDSLYGFFREILKTCNPREDTIYIFSDTHPYWYYVEREFKHIIKLEDAYNSFDREVKTHEMQGIWAGIQNYEGGIYPKMYFRSDKIEKIIVSSIPEDIDDYYYSKMEVLDTKALDQEYRDEISKCMLHIYGTDSSVFTNDAVLLLTQPLALFGYCTEKEQKKLMKKMCNQYKGSPILIKPHPADKMNYKYLGGTILPKNVPIEIYNYMDVSIAQAITFGSSAIETIEFAREKKAFFKLHDFEFEDVVVAIKELIKEDPISIVKRVRRKAKRMVGMK